MKPTSSAKGVLETILEWSTNRPAWQRDGLRRILAKGRLDQTDIAELTLLCKQAHGLSVPGSKVVPLDASHLPANPGAGDSVTLRGLKDVAGANCLAPAQALPLSESGLVVIYGHNAAGKSGYARILKNACRARFPGKIYGNIYAATPQGPPSATIEYSVGGRPQAPVSWTVGGAAHAALSAVSVFDGDCASVLIGSKNEVAFRPFGLDVPDELANACQQIKETLLKEQRQLQSARHPVFGKPSWKDSTIVGLSLATLSHDTSAAKLEALAKLTEEEQGRLGQLRDALGKDPIKAANEQKAKADNVKSVIGAISRMEEETSDKALRSAFGLAVDRDIKHEAARVAAEGAFSSERLPGVGAQTWRALWDAARRYSTQAAYPGSEFPVTEDGALCVLCQQPLEEATRQRLRRFERFVQDDTARLAYEAKQLADAALTKLLNQNLRSRPVAGGLREVALHDVGLAKTTRRYIASARLRRHVVLMALGQGAAEIPVLPRADDPRPALAELEKGKRLHADEIRNSARAEEHRKLESELAELADRATLQAIMPTVNEELTRLKNLEFIARCLEDTPTNAITKLGNDIADTVITPQLRDRFQREIVELAAEKVRVEIVRSGGKFGSPQYEVRFFAKPDARVVDVLSEGERTCVALATFLTELATAQHTSSLVFDDPVSSLDHRWRRQVAKRLTTEAKQRQVIVFTHDLVFVNDLLICAEGQATSFLTVSKEENGAGVVAEGLPWDAKSTEDRIDKLEKDARAAKKLYDVDAQGKYAAAAIEVYNLLRAAWERAIEEIAFAHVLLRHRDFIDTRRLKKASVLTEADCDTFHAGFKKCCDITSAHDRSMGRNAGPPPASELLADVQALKDWVKSLRDRQKPFN